MPRSVVASVVQLVAGVLLIVATMAMPWSIYRSILPKVTTGYRSGSLGVWLVLLAATSVALSLGSLTQPLKALQRLQLVNGSTALVVSIALALRKISAANHVLVANGGQTTYAIGAVIAV